MKNILPGDVVLADGGFDIADSIGFYYGQLKIPAFTKGKPQLSSLDVETTRRIASVRIHVERVVGLLQNKYKVLQSILPLGYLLQLKMVCVQLTKWQQFVVLRQTYVILLYQ